MDTLREYGSRQHVQVLCLKAETYPHKVKTSPQAETLRDGGSRFAGFTPKVKTCATTFRVIRTEHRDDRPHPDFCLHLGGAVFKPLLGARARPPLKGDVHRDT